MSLGKFDPKVVKKLNKFFKQWQVAPSAPPYSEDAENFYFLRRPAEDEEDNYDYEQYQYMDPIPEWEALANLTLFKGEFFQLVSPIEFFIFSTEQTVEVKETVNRAFRPDTKVSVVNILRQAAYIGFDPMLLATHKAGLIESIKIDKKTKYPTLIIKFEVF